MKTKYLAFATSSILALLILTACTYDRVRNIEPEQPLTLSEQSGLIVGSVTAPRAEHYWQVAAFPYRKDDGSIAGVLESASATADFLWIKDRPIDPGGIGPDKGLEHLLGRVFAIKLPAGSYTLYPSGVLNKEPFIPITPAKFEVGRGEIRYIGNLNLQGCLYTPRNKRTWRGRIEGSIPSVRDEITRDLPLLIMKYPHLTGKNIVPAVVDDHAWSGIRQLLHSRLETSCPLPQSETTTR